MTELKILNGKNKIKIKTDLEATQIVTLLEGISKPTFVLGKGVPSVQTVTSVDKESASSNVNAIKEKVLKSKSIFKKVNAHTIKVADNILDLDKDIKEGSKVPGTDYYVYKDVNDTYYISIVSPKIADTSEPKFIGGFHYGLIPEDFEARNNISTKQAKKIRGINFYSMWDYNHRPVSRPEGMVYIPKIDLWFDIYLTNSEHKKFGTSKAGKHIMCGYEEYNGRKLPEGRDDLKGEDIEAILKEHNKRLPSNHEFQVAADGVKENVSAGDEDNGIIKHMADFVSMYGIEQAVGHQWVWSQTPYSDDDEDRYLLGGSRLYGSSSGSRVVLAFSFVRYSNWFFGVRCVSKPLNPVK